MATFWRRCTAVVTATAFCTHLAVPPTSLAQQAAPDPQLDQRQTTPDSSSEPACNLTGQWRSTFGPISLWQTDVTPPGQPILSESRQPGDTRAEPLPDIGIAVSGRYRGAKGEGRVDGTISEGRLRLRWYQPDTYRPPEDAGEGDFAILDGCNEMVGFFGKDFAGDLSTHWSATRISVPTQSTQAELEQLSAAKEAMRRSFDNLRVRRDEVGGKIELPTLAAHLGDRVEDIFAFVRDEIGFEPYAGALRGAGGALTARSGNAIDKSLLLAALIRQNGVRVRFISGVLPDERASELTGQVSRPTAEAPLQIDLSADLGIDPTLYAEQRAKGEALRGGFMARVQADADFSEQMLTALPDLPAVSTGDGGGAARHQAVRQHIWVEYEAGGAWVDLDASFPSAVPGQVFAEPEGAYDELPESLWHRVQFVVSIERLDGETLTTEQVGGWEVRSADVADAGMPSFWLFNYPVDTPIDAARAWDASEVADLASEISGDKLMASSVFRPVLKLSTGEMQLGHSFDLSGHLVPDDAQARQMEAVSSAMAGAAQALDIFGPETEPAEQSVLSGYSIEYRIVGPNGVTTSHMRPVLDRIGPAARAAGSTALAADAPDDDAARHLLGTISEILVSVAPVTGRQAAVLAMDNMLANKAYVERVLDFRYGALGFNLAILGEKRDYASELLILVLLGEEMARQAAAGTKTLQSTPNVVVRKRVIEESAEGPRLKETIDLVSVDRDVVAPAREAAVFQRRYGLLMTALEAELVGEGYRRQCPDCSPALRMNMGEIMRRAERDGIDLAVLRPDQALSADQLSLPPDYRARLARDLASGWWVVVPLRSIAIGGEVAEGWWRVDPATGAVRGMIGSDGAAGVEKGILERVIGIFVLFWPTMVALPIAFFSCMSFGGGGSTEKGALCFFCALVTAGCWNLSYLTQTLAFAGPTCGFGFGGANIALCAAGML